MRLSRVSRSVGLGVVCLATALAVCGSAVAQIRFVSPPSTVSFDAVARSGNRVKILVQNEGPKDEQVEVRIDGLRTSRSDKQQVVGDVAPASSLADVKPGTTVSVVLTLRTAARPTPGRYPATLVATSSSGESVTAATALIVAESPSTRPAAGAYPPPRILPDTVSDFSISGVNFVPSVLNPWPASAVGAAILLTLVWLLFLPSVVRPKGKLYWWAPVIPLILFGFGADAAFGPNNDGFFSGRSPSLVKTASPLVAPSADRGPVGSLVAKDGTVAMAIVKPDGHLDAQYIPRAGAYTGKIDLLDGAAGGDATMTANVRDYWPWAVLVIAAGVLIGFALTRYLTLTRPRMILNLTLDKLSQQAKSQDEKFVATNSEYAVGPLIERRIAKLRELLQDLDTDNTKEVSDAITAIRKYLEDADSLRSNVAKLVSEASRVEVLAKTAAIVNSDDHLAAVDAAKELTARPLDDGASLDADGTLLSARVTQVGNASDALRALSSGIAEASQFQKQMNDVDTDGLSDDDKKTLAGFRSDFTAAVAALVSATSAADVDSSVASMHEALFKAQHIGSPPDLKEVPLLTVTGRPMTLDYAGRAPLRLSRFTQDPALVVGTPTDTTPDRRRQFQLTDRRVTAISGLLAVLSGLVSLYATSATWGTTTDYLSALLWGSVVSEGSKYALWIVSKMGSPTG